MGYWESALDSYLAGEERYESSCMECDCGHLIPEGGYYYTHTDGQTYCRDCAYELPDYCEDVGVCEDCGKHFEEGEGHLIIDGKHWCDECWQDSVDYFSEEFRGWTEY